MTHNNNTDINDNTINNINSSDDDDDDEVIEYSFNDDSNDVNTGDDNYESSLTNISYHEIVPMGQVCSTTTIFVGDLAYFTTEKDLLNLFRPFHPISIKIMRNSSTSKSMQYGFVEVILLLLNILLLLQFLLKVESVHFAEHAILTLNGKSFKGRTLRLNFASYKSQQLLSMDQMLINGHNNSFNNNNSVHVKFLASKGKNKKKKAVVTEELLTQIFTIFGEVVDCAIKESAFDKVNNYQYGYAFVHFAEINGALTAAGVYSNSLLDHIGISIKCTLSKNLMRSMATTLNINLPFMFNQFEGPHPYIMSYENYGPLPPSPYTMNGIHQQINPWNEFSELHSDHVNITDLMHPIQMIPMVSNENNIINYANMNSSNDFNDFRGNYFSNQ
jgi:hypothetical protein